MPLDPATLLMTDILVMLLVGISFAVAWLEDRKQSTLLWMMAAAVLTAAGVTVRVSLPTMPAIVLGNGLVEAGAICVWIACRRLSGRRQGAWLLGLPILLWLGLALTPGFLDNTSLRLVVANLVMALTFGLSGLEVLRLDAERRYYKTWAAGLLLVLAAEDLGWVLFNLLSPAARGTAFMSIRGFAFIDITTLIFTLLMAFAMKSLIRGQSEQAYRRAAMVDALTGLGNRRGFDALLAGPAIHARRRGTPIGVVMIDVDHFKLYNDLYGHLNGDACLRAIAQALQAGVIRPDETVFRFGGEEFVALLTNHDRSASLVVAERLRLGVRGLRLLHGGREGGVVTISLGVAVMAAGGGQPGLDDVLAAADRALYEAKRQGRDRVIADDASDGAPGPRPTRRLAGRAS